MPSVQSSLKVLFSYCQQNVVPVLLKIQSGATLGLCWSDHMPALSSFARTVVIVNCRALSLQCPLRGFHWCVGPIVRQDVFSQSVCWGNNDPEPPVSLCCPCELLLMGRASSQIKCLPPTHCWSCNQTGVHGYLPLYPGNESHWSSADHCLGCLNNATHVVPLWMDSC